jgi:hypothetical protein
MIMSQSQNGEGDKGGEVERIHQTVSKIHLDSNPVEEKSSKTLTAFELRFFIPQSKLKTPVVDE